MSKARLIITAVVDEKRTKSEVARDYNVSRDWVQQLVRRYLAEGEAAFEPQSRRPHSSPHAIPAGVEDEIVRLRKELSRQGLDAGADTIRTHLARRTPRSQTSSTTAPPSVSTIWRILARRGFLTPLGPANRADPAPARIPPPPATEEPTVVLAPLRSRTAQPALASRHDSLA